MVDLVAAEGAVRAHAHGEHVVRGRRQRHEQLGLLAELGVLAGLAHGVVGVERLLKCVAGKAQGLGGLGHGVCLGKDAIVQALLELLGKLLVKRVAGGLVVHGVEVLAVEVGNLVIDVVGLARLAHEALAVLVEPQDILRDELGLAGLHGAEQNAVRAAMADVASALVETHLQALASAALADLGVDAHVVGHVLGDHLVVAAEATRGDNRLLGGEGELVALDIGRLHASYGAGLVHHELGALNVEAQVSTVGDGEVGHGAQCVGGSVGAVVATLDGVLALERHRVLEGDLQIAREPVDGLAVVLGSPLLDVVSQLVAVAAQEVVEQGGGLIVDAGCLLKLGACAVESAQGQDARTHLGIALLEHDDARTFLGGSGSGSHARSACADDKNVALGACGLACGVSQSCAGVAGDAERDCAGCDSLGELTTSEVGR